jgi:hypothetical protein
MGPSTVRPHEQENTAYEGIWLWRRRLDIETQLDRASVLQALSSICTCCYTWLLTGTSSKGGHEIDHACILYPYRQASCNHSARQALLSLC